MGIIKVWKNTRISENVELYKTSYLAEFVSVPAEVGYDCVVEHVQLLPHHHQLKMFRHQRNPVS